jgi:hypothetical protein
MQKWHHWKADPKLKTAGTSEERENTQQDLREKDQAELSSPPLWSGKSRKKTY